MTTFWICTGDFKKLKFRRKINNASRKMNISTSKAHYHSFFCEMHAQHAAKNWCERDIVRLVDQSLTFRANCYRLSPHQTIIGQLSDNGTRCLCVELWFCADWKMWRVSLWNKAGVSHDNLVRNQDENVFIKKCQRTGGVSLTFRELSKIFSRNLYIIKIALLMRISSFNFVTVPKAWLWAHVQRFSLKFSA